MSDSRGKQAGKLLGESTVEMLHLMYNKNTSLRVLDALIDALQQARVLFTKKDIDDA